MTPLRKRMTEQLQLRNLSKITEETYLKCVERFAKFFKKSPELLGPEQVREYLLHLKNDRKVQATTVLVNRSALRFLYVETLRQKWFDEEIARPKRLLIPPDANAQTQFTRASYSRTHQRLPQSYPKCAL